MPRSKAPKKCVYAQLEGRERNLAFASWLRKELGHGKPKRKPKNRDKDGNFIVTANHVSQIMKRRAEKIRRNKEASAQVWRDAAKRKADEERAEAFNRAFFGTSDKMEQERIREEMWKKRRIEIQKENEEKLKTMPYNEWFAQYRNNGTLASEWCAPIANKIRTAWRVYARRTMKRNPRKWFSGNIYKIPKRAYPARSVTFSPVVRVSEYDKNSTWDEAPHTKKFKATQEGPSYNDI